MHWLAVFCFVAVKSWVTGTEGQHFNNKLEDVVERLSALVTEQSLRISGLEARLEGSPCKYVKNDSAIAFTVGLSETFRGGDDDAVIPYDLIHLNHGRHYSKIDYHFTAPVRGLYWFSVSLFAEARAKVFLVVNGERVLIADDGNYWGGDSNSGILMLEVGDRVACHKFQSDHDLTEQYIPAVSNVFSGFLYAQL